MQHLSQNTTVSPLRKVPSIEISSKLDKFFRSLKISSRDSCSPFTLITSMHNAPGHEYKDPNWHETIFLDYYSQFLFSPPIKFLFFDFPYRFTFCFPIPHIPHSQSYSPNSNFSIDFLYRYGPYWSLWWQQIVRERPIHAQSFILCGCCTIESW